MESREADRSARRPGRRLRRVVVALGGTFLILAGLEVGLRATGAWMLGAQRGRATAHEGDGPAFTILFVGDSWTQGAPYGRYPDELVRRLGARTRGVPLRQINTGRAGTNSSQALRRLPAELAAHRPDLLLVLTGNNDHHNLTDSTYWQFRDDESGRPSVLAARARVLTHSLRTFRVARTLWQAAAGRPTPNDFFDATDRSADRAALVAIDAETHHRQLEYNLTRFVEMARREGVPIVFQTYFHFHGYRVNETIRGVAWRHGVPLVDHNLLFHTAIPAGRRPGYRIADGHPNARGYAWMADNVAAVLESRGLTP